MVQKTKGIYKIGNTRIHIGPNSPLVKKHHMNWRLKAMQNLERQNQKSLNYSLVLSASRKDIEKIRKRVLDFISDVEAIYMPSSEEAMQCLNLDFFPI